MNIEKVLEKIDSLSIPADVRGDFKNFVSQIISFYKEDLLSIIAFGSCVTGDYFEKSSDVNLFVVYSDLNIADLNAVASLAKKWLEKRNFSPRFISRRNLISSAKYFQIDMLEMKDAYVVLCGEDLLKDMNINSQNLHWQLSYEIKAIRMRLKQQFWATTGDPLRIRRVLLERFTSLIHLSRVLLYLRKKEPPISHRKIMEIACSDLGITKDFIDTMFKLKNNEIKLGQTEAVKAFTDMMEAVRIIDKHVDEVNA